MDVSPTSQGGNSAEPTERENTKFYIGFPPTDTALLRDGSEATPSPAIFDSSWRFHRDASRYLRDRAMGSLGLGADGALQKATLPTRKSLKTFAEALADFLEWSASTGHDWKTLTYLLLLKGYQDDMATGRWSAAGTSLAARTINLRVGEAVRFLEWAAAKNLRAEIEVPKKAMWYPRKRGESQRSAGTQISFVRTGGVRVDPKNLRMPTDTEIDTWLRGLRVLVSPTKCLMCELILATGIRREEAVQWQIDTLPLAREDWNQLGSEVQVRIEHGAKGKKRRNQRGIEIGPSRNIIFPLSLAIEIDHYRTFTRPKVRARFVENTSDPAERRRRIRNTPRQLFLSESTGQPISAQRFYEAWVKPKSPFKGWCPQTGRDYWACKTLALAFQHHRRSELSSDQSMRDFEYSAIDTIDLIIQPQLGHISHDTTMIYLTWIRRVVMLTDISTEYGKRLDEIIRAPRI